MANDVYMKLFKSISRRLITSHPRSGRFVSLLVLSGVLSGAVAMVTLVVAIVVDSYFHWSYRERINTLTMFIFIPSACVCIISFAIAIATQVLRRWLQGGALRWVAAGVGVGGSRPSTVDPPSESEGDFAGQSGSRAELNCEPRNQDEVK